MFETCTFICVPLKWCLGSKVPRRIFLFVWIAALNILTVDKLNGSKRLLICVLCVIVIVNQLSTCYCTVLWLESCGPLHVGIIWVMPSKVIDLMTV